MVAGLASEATPQGLESELMWLPRGVATHIEVRASPAAYPCAPCSHHTPGMHRGVNVTFTAGRWGAWLASPGQGIVPLSPLPCSCSLSRQLGGLMSHQTHPPIKFMVYPSIVWCSPVSNRDRFGGESTMPDTMGTVSTSIDNAFAVRRPR